MEHKNINNNIHNSIINGNVNVPIEEPNKENNDAQTTKNPYFEANKKSHDEFLANTIFSCVVYVVLIISAIIAAVGIFLQTKEEKRVSNLNDVSARTYYTYIFENKTVEPVE